MVHDVNSLTVHLPAERIDAVISGQSNRRRSRDGGGILDLNPGSAGPRRFVLPIAVARCRSRSVG